MKKYSIANALIAIVLLTLFPVCIWQGNKIKELGHTVSKLDETNKGNIKLFNEYISQEANRVKSEAIMLETNKELLTKSMVKINLSGLKINKPVLVYRMIDKSCNVCIENEFALIKKIIAKTGAKNLWVFSTFKTERDFYVQSRSLSDSIKIFNIASGFNLDIEKSERSYFFVLDTNYVTRMVFSSEHKNYAAFLELVDVAVKKYLN